MRNLKLLLILILPIISLSSASNNPNALMEQTLDIFVSRIYLECFAFYKTMELCVDKDVLSPDVAKLLEENIEYSRTLGVLYHHSDEKATEFASEKYTNLIHQVEEQGCKGFFTDKLAAVIDQQCRISINDPLATYLQAKKILGQTPKDLPPND